MRTKAFCLFVAIVGVVALVSGSAAATQANGIARIDVSTRASIVEYLRSIHVNPTGVVIERGSRNYAGPHCPGARWTCTTTAHPVVQVASARGRNRFLCSTAKCAVVQVAGPTVIATNTAACIKTTGLAQTCTITQSNATGDNKAVVYERIASSAGVKTATTTSLKITQTATSHATITQTATGDSSAPNSNEACVYQEVAINRAGAPKKNTVSVLQSAHQTVTIKQDSANGGNSAAESATSDGQCTGAAITQRQTVSSSLNVPKSLIEKQNAASKGANVAIDIEQNQSAGFLGTALGQNSVNFDQYTALTAIGNSSNGPVVQTQSSPTGGLLGTVNQDSDDVSTATTTQTEIECEDAAKTGLVACHTNDPDAAEAPATLTQTQFGPIHKAVHKGLGIARQTGNSADTFSITQSSTQDFDQGVGGTQTNDIQGDCITDGSCTVTQHTDINGQQTNNVTSGHDVNTSTNCTGSSCGSTSGELLQHVDVGEFAQGGMRGSGSSTIGVSGITGSVVKAYLYWQGLTNSNDPNANATVSFKGTAIKGQNIGTASSNCWGSDNSQAYRADVTKLVTGNGTYALANFTKDGGSIADTNGVALFVFYNDGNSANDRNVAIWNGNDSNIEFGNDPQDWDETIGGVPYPGSGTAHLDLVVADGQTFDDGELDVNGTTIAPAGPLWEGDTGPSLGDGSLWDLKSFNVTSLLSAGSNNLHITSPLGGDCLSLVVAAANMPAHPSSG
ncbi:MAG: hypothetical protein QOG85_58 [Gaiellaceae bacterium]|jgi:hypothetical protein|nr:hypothetical protein [Gaiellaceae bacterium]